MCTQWLVVHFYSDGNSLKHHFLQATQKHEKSLAPKCSPIDHLKKGTQRYYWCTEARQFLTKTRIIEIKNKIRSERKIDLHDLNKQKKKISLYLDASSEIVVILEGKETEKNE